MAVSNYQSPLSHAFSRWAAGGADSHRMDVDPKNKGLGQRTRTPASADRTARRQFQALFPVITGSFPTNVIAHLHGLSMDLTVGRTVGPTVDSTVG